MNQFKVQFLHVTANYKNAVSLKIVAYFAFKPMQEEKTLTSL